MLPFDDIQLFVAVIVIEIIIMLRNTIAYNIHIYNIM